MDHGLVIRRRELSDTERKFVWPLLPVSSRGRQRLDGRTVLNGVVWRFRTGTAWRGMPERYGPWAPPHTRFHRWAKTAPSSGCCGLPGTKPLRPKQTRVSTRAARDDRFIST
ncbi:transposase [Streptomyces sp. NPDC051132]|uniref:transposase n=1 Tax=unclassified Streptomyces TaxID=2593676 RepID=UPI0034471744